VLMQAADQRVAAGLAGERRACPVIDAIIWISRSARARRSPHGETAATEFKLIL
jgi:hypothetical protein